MKVGKIQFNFQYITLFICWLHLIAYLLAHKSFQLYQKQGMRKNRLANANELNLLLA